MQAGVVDSCCSAPSHKEVPENTTVVDELLTFTHHGLLEAIQKGDAAVSVISSLQPSMLCMPFGTVIVVFFSPLQQTIKRLVEDKGVPVNPPKYIRLDPCDIAEPRM